MIYFKSCPRCRGDVNVRSDWYGEYQECLQCGWSKDTTEEPLARFARIREDVVAQAVIKRAS